MLLGLYRSLRVIGRQMLGSEPIIYVDIRVPLEFHGNDYCGWCIPRDSLRQESVVVDIGLGEDVSFSQSVIARYGCKVHGFDPTPRALQYVKGLGETNLVLHELAVAARKGEATFLLPNNSTHVSGSLTKAAHVGRQALKVNVVTLGDVFDLTLRRDIDLLKVDIEGAEYELIADPKFADYAPHIKCLCIEFHHRWSNFGKQATMQALNRLRGLGFGCAWRAPTTNEEFMFVNTLHATYRPQG